MSNQIVKINKNGETWSKLHINEYDDFGELHNMIMRKMVTQKFYSQESLLLFLKREIQYSVSKTDIDLATKSFDGTVNYIEKHGIPSSIEDIVDIELDKKVIKKMMKLIESEHFNELSEFSRNLNINNKAIASIGAHSKQFGNSQFGCRPFIASKWPWKADYYGAGIGSYIGGPLGAGIGAAAASGIQWLFDRRAKN